MEDQLQATPPSSASTFPHFLFSLCIKFRSKSRIRPMVPVAFLHTRVDERACGREDPTNCLVGGRPRYADERERESTLSALALSVARCMYPGPLQCNDRPTAAHRASASAYVPCDAAKLPFPRNGTEWNGRLAGKTNSGRRCCISARPRSREEAAEDNEAAPQGTDRAQREAEPTLN